MIHKEYTGAIEVDEDSGIVFGTVLGTGNIITFVGKTVEEARQSLADSVDFYLEHCVANGKERGIRSSSPSPSAGRRPRPRRPSGEGRPRPLE